MATEKRLIDANKAKFFIADVLDIFGVPVGDRMASRLIGTIDNLSTVDAVEVPCKIGDFVWAVRNYKGHKHPQRGVVSDMYFSNDMRLQIVVKHVARGEWGKTVFATDKEAYDAIGERKCDETD